MFYRHKQSLMYDSRAIIGSFTLSEFPFILMVGTIFSLLFYFPMGFAKEASKFFLFWFFVTFAVGNFTYLGQMLVSLFRDSQTAQGFGALIITCTSLFSGILIKPSNIPNFWIFMYW